jgi:hypothetical protein
LQKQSPKQVQETDAPDFALLLSNRAKRCSKRTCAERDNQFAAIVHTSSLTICLLIMLVNANYIKRKVF